MIEFLKRLFRTKIEILPDTPTAIEQALLLSFKGPFKNIDKVLDLEEVFMEKISELDIGEVDGNEVAMDGSEVTFYMYGPDADALFIAVEPILKRKKWIKNVVLTRRYGPADDPEARELVTTIN